ncbi:MAG TPA: DNA primase [Burkholderiales bacterium]|nr:DNA primase [Burkholderiales bacterium]
MIPESFKQDLLNRVDIVEVVSRYVRLKKGGANFQGLCPFHNEKSPSFTVSPAKQFYHCFGCGAHGNAIGFLMSYGGLGYVDSVKDLAAMAGMQVPEAQPRSREEAERETERKEQETSLVAVMEKTMEFYRAELKKTPRAIEYLKARGLTGEIAARFRIGFAPDDWQGLKSAFPDYEHKSLVDAGLVIASEGKRYDRFRDRIMFPILNARGAVIGFGGRVLDKGEPKYLNSPETPLFEKGREVYGLVQARDAMRAAGRVLVVEGYMDVVALAQFDIGYAVATLGTATTPVHVSKLLRLTDELVFSYDGDSAGRKAAWRALETSLPLATDAKPIRFLFLPAEHDPDSYVRAHGKEAFEQLVREAPTLSEFLIAELRAQHDLNTPEGRAGFLIASKTYLEKLTAPALRIQLLREFALLAKVSTEDIEKLIQPNRPPAFQRSAPARTTAPIAAPLERQLLRYVLLVPKLVKELEVDLLNQNLTETGFLNFIAGREVDENASSAFLIEFFQGTDFEQMVYSAQAEIEEQRIPVETMESEFQNVHIALRINRMNQEIDDLKAKVNADPRLGQRLNVLVKELGQLKNQRASPLP